MEARKEMGKLDIKSMLGSLEALISKEKKHDIVQPIRAVPQMLPISQSQSLQCYCLVPITIPSKVLSSSDTFHDIPQQTSTHSSLSSKLELLKGLRTNVNVMQLHTKSVDDGVQQKLTQKRTIIEVDSDSDTETKKRKTIDLNGDSDQSYESDDDDHDNDKRICYVHNIINNAPVNNYTNCVFTKCDSAHSVNQRFGQNCIDSTIPEHNHDNNEKKKNIRLIVTNGENDCLYISTNNKIIIKVDGDDKINTFEICFEFDVVIETLCASGSFFKSIQVPRNEWFRIIGNDHIIKKILKGCEKTITIKVRSDGCEEFSEKYRIKTRKSLANFIKKRNINDIQFSSLPGVGYKMEKMLNNVGIRDTTEFMNMFPNHMKTEDEKKKAQDICDRINKAEGKIFINTYMMRDIMLKIIEKQNKCAS